MKILILKIWRFVNFVLKSNLLKFVLAKTLSNNVKFCRSEISFEKFFIFLRFETLFRACKWDTLRKSLKTFLDRTCKIHFNLIQKTYFECEKSIYLYKIFRVMYLLRHPGHHRRCLIWKCHVWDWKWLKYHVTKFVSHYMNQVYKYFSRTKIKFTDFYHW